MEEEQNASQDIMALASSEENIDDVLELSPDMRLIDEPATEINLEEEETESEPKVHS